MRKAEYLFLLEGVVQNLSMFFFNFFPTQKNQPIWFIPKLTAITIVDLKLHANIMLLISLYLEYSKI